MIPRESRNQMKLRVWWIPQIPMETPFYVDVKDEFQANLMLNTLAEYDSYQFENKVKPDYSNVGGLEMFKDGEWCDWCNEDYDDFDEYREEVLSK